MTFGDVFEGDAPSSSARRARSVPPLLSFSWRATFVCLALARPRPMARPPQRRGSTAPESDTRSCSGTDSPQRGRSVGLPRYLSPRPYGTSPAGAAYAQALRGAPSLLVNRDFNHFFAGDPPTDVRVLSKCAPTGTGQTSRPSDPAARGGLVHALLG